MPKQIITVIDELSNKKEVDLLALKPLTFLGIAEVILGEEVEILFLLLIELLLFFKSVSFL